MARQKEQGKLKPKTESPRRRQRKAQMYDTQYRKMAKFIRDTATHCHICGEGARINDPWEADHLVPGDPSSQLAPAHRTCNRIRSNKPLRNIQTPERNKTAHIGRHIPWGAIPDGDSH